MRFAYVTSPREGKQMQILPKPKILPTAERGTETARQSNAARE
jgi:hypothetical protein